jgi:hypothetical protein
MKVKLKISAKSWASAPVANASILSDNLPKAVSKIMETLRYDFLKPENSLNPFLPGKLTYRTTNAGLMLVKRHSPILPIFLHPQLEAFTRLK